MRLNRVSTRGLLFDAEKVVSISACAERRIGKGKERPMSSHLQQIISLPSIDADYSFGRPKLYLAPKELAHLTVLRSKLGDTRAERAAEPLPVPAHVRG